MARKDPIGHLSRHRGGVPPSLEREILALGAAAVPGLLALLDAPAAIVPDSERDVAASNALVVLRGVDDPALLPAVLRILREAPVRTHALGIAMLLLDSRANPALVEELLAIEGEPERLETATTVLAQCKVHDDRIRARIEAIIRSAPLDGALLASDYGDLALLPALQAAFDTLLGRGIRDPEDSFLLTSLLDEIVNIGGPEPIRHHLLEEEMLRSLDDLSATLADQQNQIAALLRGTTPSPLERLRRDPR